MRPPLLQVGSSPTRVGRKLKSLEPEEHEFRPTALSHARKAELAAAIRNSSFQDAPKGLRDLSEIAHAQALNASQTDDPVEELKLAVASSLLADLAEQGWSLRLSDDSVFVRAPSFHATGSERLSHVKSRIRRGLQFASNRQLASQSVSEFIQRMESLRDYKGKVVSVTDLVDSGADLVESLQAANELPDHARNDALGEMFKPIIQVCGSDDRCQKTGLKLLDVWRYFRHTWSLEYNPLPGRTLRFLIRNAARPNHPIIGIAMLASPTANLTSRDEWIGWQIESLEHDLLAGQVEPKVVAKQLVSAISAAISEIRSDDMIEAVEISKPDANTIFKLDQIAAKAEADRRADLSGLSGNNLVDIRDVNKETIDDDGWRALSETALFRKKRAEQLSSLLSVLMILEKFRFKTKPAQGLYEAMIDKDGRSAIRAALNEIKKRKLSSEVADLAVCGALPPYNELLGGKLVTLLMASQEVREFYRKRYSDQTSEISSQIAGQAISRDATLRAITTTSLYGVASSQYNRLKLDVRHSPELGGQLLWKRLRDGSGVSVTHVSARTVALMKELSKAHFGRKRVNSVFGEGSSPRMRQIREGLGILGINDDSLLKQHTGRKVYGCALYEGAREDLVGFSKRRRKRKAPGAKAITTGWISRWLSSRAKRTDVLDRMSGLNNKVVSTSLAARIAETRCLEPPDQSTEAGRPTLSTSASSSETLTESDRERVPLPD